MLRPTDVLSTIRDTLGTRVEAGTAFIGRVKDIYFDDQEWKVRHLLISFRGQSGEFQRLIPPHRLVGYDNRRQRMLLGLSDLEVLESPLPEEIKPVCKQYESFSMGSPSSRNSAFGRVCDPHLRAWKAVASCELEYGGGPAGLLHNMAFDQQSGLVRNLQVTQVVEGRWVHFQVLPSAVERISWATQRIYLHYLSPLQDPASTEITPFASGQNPVAA